MNAPTPPLATTPNGLTRTAVSPLLAFVIDLLIAVGVLLLLSVAGSVVWGVFRGFEVAAQAHADGLTPSADEVAAMLGAPGALAQMLIAMTSTGAAALLLYFWRRRADAAERAASRRALGRASTWGLVLLVGCGVFLFSALVSTLAERFGWRPTPSNLPLMEQALDQWPWFLMTFAVLIAPAYEELLFRRVLFGRLLAAGKPWLGMLLSSLAFALMHEIPGLSGNGPLAILQLWLVYAGMGAAFAWVYWRTGTLWASIAAHALNNGIALAALYFLGIQ